ncbi:hypothetical protein PMIN06_004618 [Paraphaeosphaeria minitans]
MTDTFARETPPISLHTELPDVAAPSIVQKYPTTPPPASPEIARLRPSAQITRPCHPTSACLTLQILRCIKHIRIPTGLHAPDYRGLKGDVPRPVSFPLGRSPIIKSPYPACSWNVTCMAKNTSKSSMWRCNVDGVLMLMLQSKEGRQEVLEAMLC